MKILLFGFITIFTFSFDSFAIKNTHPEPIKFTFTERIQNYDSILRKALIGKKIEYISGFPLESDSILKYPIQSKVTILNFWFTKCPTCKLELNALQKLNFTKDDLSILLITSTNRDIVKEFVKREKVDLPIIIDRFASIRWKFRVK